MLLGPWLASKRLLCDLQDCVSYNATVPHWVCQDIVKERLSGAYRGTQRDTRRQWELDYALWAWQTAEDNRYVWLYTPVKNDHPIRSSGNKMGHKQWQKSAEILSASVHFTVKVYICVDVKSHYWPARNRRGWVSPCRPRSTGLWRGHLSAFC